MEEESESVQVWLDRSNRATRGKRMTKFLDDEAQADEEFWGQDAFKEVAEDVEYEAEEDVVDEFDSDFDEDEANAEEEAPEDEVERVKRKRLLPPGSKPLKKDKKNVITPKTKGLDVIEAAVAAAVNTKDDEEASIQPPKSIQEGIDISENFTDLEIEKTVRKSTRTAVVIRQAEREALRAAMQATTIKPVKKKREGEKRITQEDMLLEAAQTEILNQQHLERMLAREEEVKQKAIVHKTVYNGPQVRFYSRDGENLLEFMGDISEWQQLFEQPTQSQKRPQVCAVTGLPAKYLDPLTGLPYATTEAFKMIRERIGDDDITRERMPGKNLRSARSISGRPSVPSSARKPRRSVLYSYPHGALHGKLSCVEARAVSHKSNIQEEAQKQPYDLEASLTNRNVVDLNTWLVLHSNSPHEPMQSHALLDSSQDIELVKTGLHAPTSTHEEPLWVEIPPPKEGPSEDDYLLEDLTSLDFGPILAAQHDFTSESRREDELEVSDPTSEGMFLPLDVLPMPPEFSSNVLL